MNALTAPEAVEPAAVAPGPRRQRRGGRRPTAARTAGEVLVLLALTVAFFFPLLRGATFSTVPGHQTAVYPWAAFPSRLTDAYPQSDQADLSFPWQTFLSDSLRDGALPLWEPHSYGGGYPFFANGQSAPLYPPRLLTALLLDPGWAHDVFSFVHVLAAGLAMRALMKEFGAGTAGSLLAAVAWMFAGFNMAWLHLEVVAPMSVFLPLVVLCVHRAVRLGSWPAAVVAGLALGATLMSGHLVLLGIVYLVGVVYLVALATPRAFAALRSHHWRRLATEAGRVTLVVAVSLGAAAVVLVPTMAALLDSQRDPFTYAELRGSFLAPARTFLHTFTPPPLPITQDHMHEMTFAGTVTAMLAVVGLFVRRRGAWMARGLMAAAFLIAVGTPATWVAYHFIPGFDVFRPYSRLVVFWSFAVAVLGGLGLDVLERRSGADPGSGGGRRLVAGVSVLAVALTSLQLIRHGRQVNPPFVERGDAVSYPATPLIDAVRSEVDDGGQWPGRILPVRVVAAGGEPPPPILFAAESLVFGIDTTGGYDSAVPRRVTALIRVLQGEDPESVIATGLPSAYAPTFVSTTTRFDLMERLGITTVVATPAPAGDRTEVVPVAAPATRTVYEGPDGRVLEVLGSAAGPRLVHSDELAVGEGRALRRFIEADFDFASSLVVEAEELRRSGYRRLAGSGTGRVESASRGVNSAAVTVSSTASAWLVLPTSWAPGWSATVNGRRAPVMRANYAKQAVQVPAGTSVVELRYRPSGWAAGIAATVVTILAAATTLVPRRARRRPADRPPEAHRARR